MKATLEKATSKESQATSQSRPQAPKEESTQDRQKVVMQAVRRCNTNLALSQNMKVFDALQLALNILNDNSPDACSKGCDQVLDE